MSKTDPILEEGRSSPSPDDLDPKVRMRLEHAGKWVAWTLDARRIVAAGDTPEAASDTAQQAGFERVILDWVPPIEERFAGA